MTQDLFDAWLAMEEPSLQELLRELPELADTGWTPEVLPILERVALERWPSPDIAPAGDDGAVWGRLLRAIGRTYIDTIAGAMWVCVPLIQPTGGAKLVPVLDVPGMPVWIEVSELIDRMLLERSGTVLASAYDLAAP